MKTKYNSNMSVDQLVDRLKKEDKKHTKASKIMMTIFVILIPLFTICIYYLYRRIPEIKVIIGGILICLSLILLIFIVFKLLYKVYSHVNYAVPTLEMLKGAASRYSFSCGYTLLIGLAIFLPINIGRYFLLGGYFWLNLLIFIASMALYMGFQLFYLKPKSDILKNNALSLIKELENGNGRNYGK